MNDWLGATVHAHPGVDLSTTEFREPKKHSSGGPSARFDTEAAFLATVPVDRKKVEILSMEVPPRKPHDQPAFRVTAQWAWLPEEAGGGGEIAMACVTITATHTWSQAHLTVDQCDAKLLLPNGVVQCEIVAPFGLNREHTRLGKQGGGGAGRPLYWKAALVVPRKSHGLSPLEAICQSGGVPLALGDKTELLMRLEFPSGGREALVAWPEIELRYKAKSSEPPLDCTQRCAIRFCKLMRPASMEVTKWVRYQFHDEAQLVAPWVVHDGDTGEWAAAVQAQMAKAAAAKKVTHTL